MPAEGLISIVIGFMVIALLVMTQFPKEWQTPGMYALIVGGGLPAGALVIAIIIQPWVLAGLLFCFGAWCAARAR